MEDVWKDITTLSSFHTPLTPNPSTPVAHHGPILRDFFTAGEQDPSAPAPAPPNSLNFNWCGDLPCYGSSVNLPFEGMASSSKAYLLDTFMKKRSSEEKDCSGDRKYKRMMKNRESAVRSRARRTAYTFELEREKSQLIEENARLRRVLQGQQLFSAAAAAAAAIEDNGEPKKRYRLRSLSALF